MENRYPDFLIASLGKRLVAFIIDLILISSITKFFTRMIMAMGAERSSDFLSPYMLTVIIIYLGYFTITSIITNGQSLGKMVMGIQIVKEYGNLTALDILTREFFVNFILYNFKIFYIVPLFNKKNKALADFFTDTIVIDLIKLEEYEFCVKENICHI